MAENTFADTARSFPRNTGQNLPAPCQDLAMLHLKWDTYLTLFGPTGDAP